MPHQPGGDERVDGRLRQPPQPLGLVGAGRDDVGDGSSSSEGIHGGGR